MQPGPARPSPASPFPPAKRWSRWLAFVIIASLTIAVPVVYYLVGGDAARTRLDTVKEWLALHNDAVMTVLLLVLGVNLISKGIPPLT